MKNQKRLRLALIANAIFSISSGISMILFRESLATLMNITDSRIFLFVGIGLLLFAGSVYYSSTGKEIKKKQIKSIIIQDWLWVIGSAVIVLFQLFNISFTGYLIIGGIALAVADFALMQGYFLRRI